MTDYFDSSNIDGFTEVSYTDYGPLEDFELIEGWTTPDTVIETYIALRGYYGIYDDDDGRLKVDVITIVGRTRVYSTEQYN